MSDALEKFKAEKADAYDNLRGKRIFISDSTKWKEISWARI